MDAEQMEADESWVLDPGFLIQDSDNDSVSDSYKSCCSGDGSDTVIFAAGNLTNKIEEFISGAQQCSKNINGKELQEDEVNGCRQIFPAWNTFLQSEQGERDSCAIISSDIKEDINKFIPWLVERQGGQCNEEYKDKIKIWLPQWNMFLQARAGKTLVTCLNVCLTVVGFIFYIIDQVSDIGMSLYYVSNGEWWRAIVSLTIVYGAITMHTVVKWINGLIHCTGSAGWLRFVASLLVNWPDIKQYVALCLLEWNIFKSSTNNARLVPEWHRRRYIVAYLKFTEGLWEACPQASMQLFLLVPNLYGDWTWVENLHIASASVSLCMAGAALVNREKSRRFAKFTEVTTCELVVLHVWAVPVTVSRLLSVTLVLSIYYGVPLDQTPCKTWRLTRTPRIVNTMCVVALQFFMSPFDVAGFITYHRVYHTIHCLVNTVATVTWALATPLVCAQPALCAGIIYFNVVMFTVGLLGWQLHKKYWPDSYHRHNC